MIRGFSHLAGGDSNSPDDISQQLPPLYQAEPPSQHIVHIVDVERELEATQPHIDAEAQTALTALQNATTHSGICSYAVAETAKPATSANTQAFIGLKISSSSPVSQDTDSVSSPQSKHTAVSVESAASSATTAPVRGPVSGRLRGSSVMTVGGVDVRVNAQMSRASPSSSSASASATTVSASTASLSPTSPSATHSGTSSGSSGQSGEGQTPLAMADLSRLQKLRKQQQKREWQQRREQPNQ